MKPEKIAIAGFTAALLAINAHAGTVTSDGADIVLNTKGGLEVKTVDGDFSFKVGGRIQAQYDTYNKSMNLSHEGDTGSDLFIRRARIYFKGTFLKDWAYKIQYSLHDSGTKGGKFEDLYIRWQKHDMFNITVGNHKEPFSLQELTSSKWVTSVERSTSADFFSEGRSIGASLQGANDFWGYGVGLYDTEEKDDDNAVLWALTGRAFLSPINEDNTLLHLGIGVSQRDNDDSGGPVREAGIEQGIKSADTLFVLTDNVKSTRLISLEAAGKFGAIHMQGQWTRQKNSAESGGDDSAASGLYGQVGWFITGEQRAYKKGVWDKVKPNNKGLGAWEIFGRIEQINFDDSGVSPNTRNKGRIVTVGGSWYINQYLRLSANLVQSNWDQDLALNGSDEVVRADSVILPSTTESSGRGFAVRLQAAF